MDTDLKSVINDILVNKEVRDFGSFIVAMIPELANEIGFDQKHPHHHLDVWEHTLLALDNLDSDDLESNMALLLHDIGKPFSYQDDGDYRHFNNHANVSSKIARTVLQRLNYDEDFINNVCYLIKYHDTVIDPDNFGKLDYKLLDIQYADAKAHHPDKVLKRIKNLDRIKEEVYNK